MSKIDVCFKHFLEYQLVSTDSRKILPNCVFFALRGEKFNGNTFAEQALEQGASYVVVDEEISIKDERVVLVQNVLSSLQTFANKYRSRFQIPVIAITGSNGKTTTKELIAKVLQADYAVHFTQGNLNNHIGVPLTLLQLCVEHEVAIIEMGANHQKEIAELCKIAEPTHGIITNIGKAHLEGFGGENGVKLGKGELFDYLQKHNGIVFTNQSERSIQELLSERTLRQVVYSNNSKEQGFVDLNNESVDELLSLEMTFFNGERHILNTNLIGGYNLPNLINAICIGIYFRISVEKIITQIESYHPKNNRSQIKVIGSNVFLLDAYNANPSSMEVAIMNFKELKHNRKIAILGDMFELGEYSKTEHARIAKLALEAEFKEVIFVGNEFPEPSFRNVIDLKLWFERQKFENTYFLLKGSRGVSLEKLLD